MSAVDRSNMGALFERVDRIERFMIALAVVNSGRELAREEFTDAENELKCIAEDIKAEHEAWK